MDKPILIGIHGVKRAGKNTTADFITEWAARQLPALSTCQRGFADKAKWAFARQFFPDCTMEQAIKWVDEFKAIPTASFVSPPIRYTDDSGMPIPGPLGNQVVIFRDALAQFSTDGGRDIYGDDHWVDLLLPMPLAVYDDASRHRYREAWHQEFLAQGRRASSARIADLCLVTDLRFDNELDRIKNLGGYNIKVRRKDAEDAVIAEAKAKGREVHRSELGIPDDRFDIVINNDDNDMEMARVRSELAIKRFVAHAALATEKEFLR